MVGSGRISNPSETLWLSLLPGKMMKIRSEMKALECSQHYTYLIRRARADNSRVCGGIWPKFDLIQAIMHVLATCKNEDESIKNERARVVTFFNYKSMKIFPDTQRQPTPQSLVRSGRISNLPEIL